MDEEAKQQLGAQALLQDAREKAKRGRQNLPFGVVLMGLGVTIVVVAVSLTEMPPFIPLGIGAMLMPIGLAVVIRSIAAIAKYKRVEREQALPQARLRQP